MGDLNTGRVFSKSKEGIFLGKLEKVFDYGADRVRTVILDGAYWFVAKDVCRILGIRSHRDAIRVLNPQMRDEVGITDSIGRVQKTIVISESGIYRLAFRSRKEEAERFTDWVALEVLPSIRDTGRFVLEPSGFDEAYKVVLSRVIAENGELAAEVEELRDVVAHSEGILRNVRRLVAGNGSDGYLPVGDDWSGVDWERVTRKKKDGTTERFLRERK